MAAAYRMVACQCSTALGGQTQSVEPMHLLTTRSHIRDAAARKMDSYRTLRVDALWQAAWQIEHGKKA